MGKYDRDLPRWAKIASEIDNFDLGLGELAIAASRLTFTRNDLRKTVVAAGIGNGFPERTLVCTVGSKFREVKPDIHELICADPAPFVDPELHLTTPVERRFVNHRQSVSSIESRGRGVSFYPDSLQELLPALDLDSVNALIFFSIPSIEEQLQKGLGELIENVLKSGGVFMGSGSFDEGKVNLHNAMVVEKSERFSDVDHAGSYFNHFGFLARKVRRP